MRFTWLGHACYEIELRDGKRVLVDPYLEDARTRRKAEDLHPDLILLTHGHADHTGSILKFPDTPVVTVPEIAGWLAKSGMRRTTGMNVGGFHKPLHGLRVFMTPALHSSGISAARAADGTVAYGGAPVGFVIDDDETRAYVAGDTGLFGDMRTVIGDLLQPHVAIVPMGDHYTMGPEHAAIAARWVGANVAVPYHYGTFPTIEQDPREFVKHVGHHAKAHVATPDETFTVVGGKLSQK